jgi:hypothetical protein
MIQIEEVFKDKELDESAVSHQIFTKIKNLEIEEILNNFCCVKNDTVFIEYVYFKYLSSNDTYNLITQHLINILDNVLLKNKLFTIHINMNSLTLNEINTHRKFICVVSTLFKNKYPNKLAKCFIHNAPKVFSKIYSIISLFIDEETQLKIQLIK